MAPHWTCKDLRPLGSKKELHGLQPGAIVRGASHLYDENIECSIVGSQVQAVFGASLSESHIDSTAGRFHILWLWYDRHPRAAVGRTKYVGLP